MESCIRTQHTKNAVPSGTGSQLVDQGGYVGTPEGAEHKLQESTVSEDELY